MKPLRVRRAGAFEKCFFLASGTEADETAVMMAQLATGKTKQANFVKPLPVYIVYFSAAALNDGKIVDYQDLYGRDGKAMAALDMKDGGASLAKPKTDQVAAK
jgi:murein L,D-transpeptidase YcbB/YkuD